MTKQLKTFVFLFSLSFFCVTLVLLRVWHTDTYYYRFMIWNLFLAWIPYLLSLGIKKSPPILKLPILALWLLFLPNAAYIITDLFHLGKAVHVPYWFDTCMLFSFSVTGMLLGAYSMILVYSFLHEKIGKHWAKVFLLLISFLSAFGIYIGRYQRWNSWDIIHRPKSLLWDCLYLLKHESFEIFCFCWTMGAIIFFSYYLLKINHSNLDT